MITGRSTSCVRCSRVGYISSFESHALNFNSHLRTTGRDQVSTECSTPCVRCSGVGHVSSFESHASNSNSHLRTTGRDQVSTGRVEYSPDSCAESSANQNLTGLGAPDGPVLTGLVHREGCKISSHRRAPLDAHRASDALSRTPSAQVRPHKTQEQGSPCVRCSTLAGSNTNSTLDARDSVWCLRALRPVSVSQ